MSGGDRKLGRHALFDVFRGRSAQPATEAAPPREASFSLGSFYEAREARKDSGGAVPAFPRRPGLTSVPTTRIGVESPPSHAEPLAGPAIAFDGVAQIREYACLAWQRSFCTVCSERCPVPGAIVIELGRPRVVAEACTGCGTCIRVCPAPVNGFDIVPRGAQ